jgi:RimJ/RimL family protein N-acetyltransferase
MLDLLPFTETDIDRLISWVPSPEAHFVWTASGFEYPLDRGTFRKFLAESAQKGDRLIFKAVERESGEAVGHIELGAIQPLHRSLRIGRVLIAPEARGRGLGDEMMRRALEIAFGELRMHRVELGVFDVNTRAIACYERVGFRREGVRREAWRALGRTWSEVLMSVLAPEWAALGGGPST